MRASSSTAKTGLEWDRTWDRLLAICDTGLAELLRSDLMQPRSRLADDRPGWERGQRLGRQVRGLDAERQPARPARHVDDGSRRGKDQPRLWRRIDLLRCFVARGPVEPIRQVVRSVERRAVELLAQTFSRSLYLSPSNFRREVQIDVQPSVSKSPPSQSETRSAPETCALRK